MSGDDIARSPVTTVGNVPAVGDDDVTPDDDATPGAEASITGVEVVDDEPTDGGLFRRRLEPPPDSSPSGRGSVSVLTIVFAVLAILGLAGTLLFGFAWNSERSEDNAEASMKTSASDFLVALFDFDGRTIDEDFDNVLSYATGDFADQAEAQFADDDTRAALREVQASSRVEVRDLFVQSFDGDSGRVFAVVDQTIANNQFPQPRSDQVRLEISMRKVDGEWKVSALDVLEAPAAQSAIAGGTVPTEGSGTTATTAPAGD
jgi:Mce-associated membrane protein